MFYAMRCERLTLTNTITELFKTSLTLAKIYEKLVLLDTHHTLSHAYLHMHM